jgi:DNA-binding response OmpR family regulator
LTNRAEIPPAATDDAKGMTVGRGEAIQGADSKRLLVIDDEATICDFVKQVAEDTGFAVAVAVNHEQFRAAYDSFRPTAILLDLVMPDVDGIALLGILADEDCQAKILIMSGFHPELLKSGFRLGDGYRLDVKGTLHKPFGSAELRVALQQLA